MTIIVESHQHVIGNLKRCPEMPVPIKQKLMGFIHRHGDYDEFTVQFPMKLIYHIKL